MKVKGAAEAVVSKRRSELNSLIPPPMRPPVCTHRCKNPATCCTATQVSPNGFDEVLILLADVPSRLCANRAAIRENTWASEGGRALSFIIASHGHGTVTKDAPETVLSPGAEGETAERGKRCSPLLAAKEILINNGLPRSKSLAHSRRVIYSPRHFKP